MEIFKSQKFWRGVVLSCNIAMGVGMAAFIVFIGINAVDIFSSFGSSGGSFKNNGLVIGVSAGCFIVMLIATLLKRYAKKRADQVCEQGYYESHKHDDDSKKL